MTESNPIDDQPAPAESNPYQAPIDFVATRKEPEPISAAQFWSAFTGLSLLFTILNVTVPLVGFLLTILAPPGIRTVILMNRSDTTTTSFASALGSFVISFLICGGILIGASIAFAAVCFPVFFAVESFQHDRYPTIVGGLCGLGLGYIASVIAYGYFFRQSLKLGG